MPELFIDQAPLPVNDGPTTEDGKTDLRQVSRLQIGAGENVTYLDKDGTRWGSMNFDEAKAWIKQDGSYQFKDDSGNVIMSKAGITQLISDTLNTQTQQILGEYTFGASGAIKIANDSNNGTWISPSGILGKKAGSTTFAIDSGGNATFKGNVLAGSVLSAGDIASGGTITGCTVRSASSGSRIELTSGNRLNMYYGTTLSGQLYAESDGDLKIWARDDIKFNTNNQGCVAQVKDSGIVPNQNNVYDLGTDPGSGGLAWRRCFAQTFYAGPSGTAGETTTRDLVTSVWWDGGDLKYNYRRYTFIGGILTDEGSEQTTGA